MFRNASIQEQMRIAHDWVQYAEMRWWEPDWFKDKDKIELSEHLKQVLRNLEAAVENNDLNGIWREIDRIRHQTIALDPDELGAGLRRCGQIALQLGQLGVALDLFHSAQYEIGTESHHYFALLNWMEGSVAWVMPSRQHDNGMNRWQESIRLFKMLGSSGVVGGSRFSWYRRQQAIMVAALDFAIENDMLPPVWMILDELNITDPDFAQGAARRTTPIPPPPPRLIENYFELFTVYEEIPAGLPGPVAFNPSHTNPAGYDAMSGVDTLEVSQVRIGETEYRIRSLVAGENRVNLIRDERHYALSVRGNSMNEAGIDDGNLVVIRSQVTAENGDIVAAEIVGVDSSRATLKRYYRRGDEITLQAESTDPEFMNREWTFTPDSENTEDGFFIRGVAVAVLKSI